MDGVAGSTAIDINVAGVTVRFAVADLAPKLAVMTEVPMATPLATPVALLTVATAALAEAHTTDGVTSTEAPSP